MPDIDKLGRMRLDVDDLRRWIGRETCAEEGVSLELARKFQATFDLPSDTVRASSPAPRLIHFCLGQPSAPTSQLGEDGHPARGGFLPPVPLPRRMWAGGSIDFLGEILIGDIVHRRARITDVAVKEGGTGTLCFVTVAHDLSVGGTVLVRERQDIVYRQGSPPNAPASAPPVAKAGLRQCRVDATETLLFRYSALTFNAHRIHYDRDYARQTEGYPGLVVHGPLQATLLLNYASDIAGRPPRRFSFRSQSPLFDDQPFLLQADERDGDTLKLWSAREAGPLAMAAEATW